MASLSGRTALVTGAGRRLGRSIASALAQAGVNLFIHHRSSEAGAEEVADAARASGVKAWVLQGDLSDPSSAGAMFRSIRSLSRIDFLINSAAVYPEGRLSSIDPESFSRTISVNALSPLALISALAAQVDDSPCAVVNILDARMTDYDRAHPGYEASKHLLFSFTRMAALEWAPRVRVNAVAPGFVDFDGRGGDAVRDAAPLKALPSPAEVAQAVLFLLESDSITGQVLYVDGGRHLKGRVFDI